MSIATRFVRVWNRATKPYLMFVPSSCTSSLGTDVESPLASRNVSAAAKPRFDSLCSNCEVLWCTDLQQIWSWKDAVCSPGQFGHRTKLVLEEAAALWLKPRRSGWLRSTRCVKLSGIVSGAAALSRVEISPARSWSRSSTVSSFLYLLVPSCCYGCASREKYPRPPPLNP